MPPTLPPGLAPHAPVCTRTDHCRPVQSAGLPRGPRSTSASGSLARRPKQEAPPKAGRRPCRSWSPGRWPMGGPGAHLDLREQRPARIRAALRGRLVRQHPRVAGDLPRIALTPPPPSTLQRPVARPPPASDLPHPAQSFDSHWASSQTRTCGSSRAPRSIRSNSIGCAGGRPCRPKAWNSSCRRSRVEGRARN